VIPRHSSSPDVALAVGLGAHRQPASLRRVHQEGLTDVQATYERTALASSFATRLLRLVFRGYRPVSASAGHRLGCSRRPTLFAT
jgi:hypothetical protein